MSCLKPALLPPDVDADLSGIEKLSDLAAEFTGETLTIGSPIPSPDMGFMGLEESQALHSLGDNFDASYHSESGNNTCTGKMRNVECLFLQ